MNVADKEGFTPLFIAARLETKNEYNKERRFFNLGYLLDFLFNNTLKVVVQLSVLIIAPFVCSFVCPPSEHRFQLISDILSISNTTEQSWTE